LKPAVLIDQIYTILSDEENMILVHENVILYIEIKHFYRFLKALIKLVSLQFI